MGDMTPATGGIEHGVSSKENAATFAELDKEREAGTLADVPEFDSEPAEKLVLKFAEKSTEELEKLTKPKLIEYMKEWYANKDIIEAAQLKHATEMATRAAIHGIPMRPRGEAIPMLLEANPEHPGRQVPYPLLDEDGAPKMSKGNKKRKPTQITRTDN